MSSSSILGEVDHFETAMLRLRRMLLGHGRKIALSKTDYADASIAEDDAIEEAERTFEQVAYRLGLQDFEAALDHMIEDARESPDALKGLLVILLEVGMWMRLYRLDDVDGAREFLGRWFFRSCRLEITSGAEKSALTQHVVTAAVVLAALASKDAKQLVSLHDSLEKFVGGKVDQGFALENLVPDPNAGFASALLQGATEQGLVDAMIAILLTRTRRQQLEDALTLAEQGERLPKDWEVFQTPLGKSLYDRFHKPNWQRGIKRALPNYHACSHCWQRFPFQEGAHFKSQRIGFCINCKKFSLDVTP